MARRKTPPLTLQTKHVLAERIMSLRMDLFGPRGGPELARRLGIPVRTWYNYEGGITVPGEILLKIIEVTSVEPMWLLHGTGPRFSNSRNEPGPSVGSSAMKTNAMPASTSKSEMDSSAQVAVSTLLKAALRLLGNDQAETSERDHRGSSPGPEEINGQRAVLDLGNGLLERNGPRSDQSFGNGSV